MTSDVSFTSAAELGGAYRAKRLSPVEVTQAALSARGHAKTHKLSDNEGSRFANRMRRIEKNQRPLWVKSGPTATCSPMSALGGRADS